MTKTFYSRVDLWYYLALLVLLYPIGQALASGEWLLSLVAVMPLALVLSMLRCVYRVDGQTLRVMCGPFPYPKMQIADIVSVRKTRTLFSAPALSLDRIVVTSVKGYRLVISPKDRVDFIQALTSVNPDIKVDEDCLLNY